jgi:hypothetical protein
MRVVRGVSRYLMYIKIITMSKNCSAKSFCRGT